MSIKTIAQYICEFKTRSPKQEAVKFVSNQQWQNYNWQEYYNDIVKVADYIKNLNIKPGSHIAIMSQTNYEWAVADLAILGIGFVTVPIYSNNTIDDIEYILKDSESVILFIDTKVNYKRVKDTLDKCSNLKHVITFEEVNSEINSFSKIINIKNTSDDFFLKAAQSVKIYSHATILYTSGTTGKPKGVILTHEAIISEVLDAFNLCGVTSNDQTIIFLPLAHILGRVDLWGSVIIGYSVAFAESIESLRKNLLDIKPTILVSVPRVFEKIYSSIKTQSEASKIKKEIFDRALAIGYEISELKLKHQPIPIKLAIEFELAKKLVINKISSALGGRLRFAISGGAPISKEIATFFHACNILILEGYGLTETTAAITVNTPFDYKFGSVGKPIGDVQIRIADDGEVLVKSKKVMKAYYNNPEATQESFIDDGWFKTGDIGIILPSGDLKLTDRKKDLIKTAGGKYVPPQKIESLFKLHPIIGHVVIHGDQKKYIVALITLDRINAKQWAEENQIQHIDWNQFIKSNELKEKISKIVSDINKELASYESIKKFHILPMEFTIESGELTPSMKVKRKLLEKNFQKIIDSLYSDSD